MILKKIPASKKSFIRLLVIFLALVMAGHPIDAKIDEDESGDADAAYPEKRKNRETWEQVLSFPGQVIVFPIRMVLKGMSWAAGNIYVPGQVGTIYDFFTSDDGLRALRPTYSTRSGGGMKIYQRNLFNEGSELEFSTKMGLNFRQKHQIAFTGLNVFSRKVHIDMLLGYRILVNESFFGIGPGSPVDDRTTFAYEKTYSDFTLGVQLGRKLSLNSILSFTHNNILGSHESGPTSIYDRYTSSDLPGLETRVRIWGGRLEVRYDSRDAAGATRSGCEITLSAGRFDQIEFKKYGFWKFAAEIKEYIHLFYGRTLMLRLAGEMIEPLEDRVVPFYYMSEIGRRETLRGFKRGRFRDHDMLLGSVEYRYPIRKQAETIFDSFLFVDAGQVARNIEKDFDWNDIQVCYGIGFRMYNRAEEMFRFVLGRSNEQFRVFLVLNP
jgi:hypothetical protein